MKQFEIESGGEGGFFIFVSLVLKTNTLRN